MSGDNQSEIIHIKSSSATNGMTTVLIGTGFLLIGGVCLLILPDLFFLVGVLFLSASIIAFVMGFFKLKEPKVSLSISKSQLTYHHRRGKWQIGWDNIQRFDVPRVHRGLDHVDLEMVGIRLRDPDTFLDNISPRLVTYLLMEQRPLVSQAESGQCASGRCYGDDLIEDQKYLRSDGRQLTGVVAMFANRMKRLQQGLGYDIFISANELDRTPVEFVSLLHSCKNSLEDERLSTLREL
ncbi:MAG: DUF2982 domain-containing protein [Pseudomonadota bacterium]